MCFAALDASRASHMISLHLAPKRSLQIGCPSKTKLFIFRTGAVCVVRGGISQSRITSLVCRLVVRKVVHRDAESSLCAD